MSAAAGIRTIARPARTRVTIELPASKSYTQRALIAAALASGESRIARPSDSTDCRIMLQALRTFGIDVAGGEPGVLRVRGSGGRIAPGDRTIHVGNAGTCMRFLAAFSTLAPGTTTLTGDDAMLRRPVIGLVRALREAGAEVSCDGDNPPVRIRGGSLSGGRVKLDASLSSQYASALMLVSPFAVRPLEIMLAGRAASEPYLAMTASVMRAFGAACAPPVAETPWTAPTGGYAPSEYTVEPDLSSATYFGSAAAITGGPVTIAGVPAETLQGDARFFDLLREMGCRVVRTAAGLEVTGGELRGVEADLNAVPDSVPAMAVTAAFARGSSRFRNIGHLRYKESDRLSALARELEKMGARVTAGPESLAVEGGELHGCDVETYEDHRIAMSFAVAGLRLEGMRIRNPDCVTKSFPGFWTELDKFLRS